MRYPNALTTSPQQFGRQDRLTAGIRAESQRLIEAAAPEVAQRERWRREGEALDEAEIVALCLGEPHRAPRLRLV